MENPRKKFHALSLLHFWSLAKKHRLTQARPQVSRQQKNCRDRSIRAIGLNFSLFAGCYALLLGGIAFARDIPSASSRGTVPLAVTYPYDLVEVRTLIPEIKVDLRYASLRNVSGKVWYPEKMPCLLYAPTAKKLVKAQELLKAQGYQLLIWDAWRPTEVQEGLYRLHKDLKIFADPNIGWSFHCIGTAVDVSLLDAKGREVKMPSDFDEVDPVVVLWMIASFPEVKEHFSILKKAMHEAGFVSISREWWHFEDREFRSKNKPKAVPSRAIGLALPPN